MKRMFSVFAALAVMFGMVALPAAADELTELEQLEAAVAYWQAEVDRLEGELEELDIDLEDLQTELQSAKDERDRIEEDIELLEDEIEDLEADLAAAVLARNALQAAYDACTTGVCRNGYITPGTGGEGGPLPEARAEVNAIQEELDGKIEELEGLEEELEEVEEVIALIEDLLEAYEELETAETALADYLAGQETVRHPGCNGIAKAAPIVAEKTAGKGKSQAATVLAERADEWNCAA